MSQRDRDRFTLDGLTRGGFVGFRSIRQLRRSGLATVPCEAGVYALLLPALAEPTFRRRSVGGWFKCQDPTVPVAWLRAKWVDGAQTLYLGRAAGAERTSLSLRLAQLVAFGSGLPIDHRGGRYLWQVARSDDLLVCWKVVADPVNVEYQLQQRFVRAFGALPFANMRLG